MEEHCNSDLDIAFLKLQEELPEQAAVANLSENIISGDVFESFGFRKPTNFEGLYSNGLIQGKALKKAVDNRPSSPIIQLKSDQIGPGMSGAPVLDTSINRIIGIVSEHYISQSD